MKTKNVLKFYLTRIMALSFLIFGPQAKLNAQEVPASELYSSDELTLM